MLEEIRVFVAVVKAGSFTRAADVLETSRSVISKKITDLETELGLRLLNRTTRRLSLTEAGDKLYRQSWKNLDSIQETVDEICSLVNEPKGRLFVNLPMSFGILHIAPLMHGFMQRYPGIQLELQFEDRRVELIDPGFDVSIRIADMEDSSLAARKIAACPHMVVAAPSYLQNRGTPKEIEGLPDKHMIISNRLQDSAFEWEFENNRGERSSVKLQAGIIANNSLAIKALVLDGAGIARMPVFLIGNEVANGTLVNLFPNLITNRKNIYAVFPRREYMPNKTRVFIDYLLEKLPPRIH